MFRAIDDIGNVVFAENIRNRSAEVVGIDIYITHHDERYRRHIGRVVYSERSICLRKKSGTDKFSFNNYIMSNATKFDKVVVHETDTDKLWVIPLQKLLNLGIADNRNGYEKRIFVSKDLMQDYIVEENKEELIKRYELK